MRRRQLISGMAMCGILAACGGEQGKPPYRYKLKVDIETPEGIRSGESVIQVQWWHGSKSAFGTQASSGYSVIGEAVPIEIDKSRTLFVLLRSSSNPDWAAWVFESIVDDVRSPGGAGHAAHPLPKGGGKEPEYPYFVHFEDSSEPSSVQEVNPRDLEASFGSGTRLRKITVQITQEPVTRKILGRLPWLRAHKGALIDPTRFRNVPAGKPLPFAVGLVPRDFYR